MQEALMASVAEQVRNKNAQFSELFRNHDTTAVAAMYTADARLMPPGADFVTGASAIKVFWESVLRAGITELKLETIEVDLIGGYTAVETGKFTLYAGKEVVDRGKYLVIWRNEDGQWKLHRDVWNSSVAKALPVGA
jgi:uncharacterized protein (TIGR02246 family)